MYESQFRPVDEAGFRLSRSVTQTWSRSASDVCSEGYPGWCVYCSGP